jgi:hypothetical protein
MSSKKSPKASVSPSKEKKPKTYNDGVQDGIDAVVKFCAAECKILKKKVKRFAKNGQYVEALEATIEMDAYEFLADGLGMGHIDLDLELEVEDE